MERREALGHDAQRGRGAVIGQAIPGREADDLELGREEGAVAAMARIAASSGAMNTAAPVAARARSASSQGGSRRGRPPAVSGRVGGEDRLQDRRSSTVELPHLRAGATDYAADRHVVQGLERRYMIVAVVALRRGPAAVPIAQAMMSTSCSSSSASNSSISSSFQPAGCAIEESADQQVGFLDAAMPGAEAQAFQASVLGP